MSTHTKGPWEWCTFDGKALFIGTSDRGRLVVMDFKRKGMHGATPRFAIRSDNMGGIMHEATVDNIATFPDAMLMIAAPKMRELLDRAKGMLPLCDLRQEIASLLETVP